MNLSRINGEQFAEMVRGGAANLYANRSVVNDLNVFPIPDGDTGDNMYMTASAGVSALDGQNGTDLGAVASVLAHGMLLGARGNSGVILSRIFAGIADGLAGRKDADVFAFAEAMQAGVKAAYGAVSVPVEGTLLTVIKDATAFANGRVSDPATFTAYFDDYSAELRRSLDRTPELLDVLKEAGVVDSGGAGFVYLFEGMRTVLNGGTVAQTAPVSPAAKAVNIDSFTSDSVLEYGYCTEFLLRLQASKTDVSHFDLDAFTAHLTAIGESVVAFLDGTLLKVHVHTMHPGEILNDCQQYGEFLTLKIENMMLQHHETTIENRFSVARQKPHKRYGAVTVASGSGICETFTSLGADVVVEGGQSMNPSAADFVRAFEETNADTIFVFPNNGNVILTAQQAASLYEKAEIRVVPTRTIGEGYAALSMFDTTSGDTDAIEAELRQAFEGVVTGMVSRATRDVEKDGISVRAGDYIGFTSDDTIYADDAERASALLSLAKELHAGTYDVLLLVCGRDAPKEETDVIRQALTRAYPRTETILIDGGQPIHDYIFILE